MRDTADGSPWGWVKPTEGLRCQRLITKDNSYRERCKDSNRFIKGAEMLTHRHAPQTEYRKEL